MLMLKVKLQYFGHLMQRTYSFEKTLIVERLKAGGEVYDRGWDGWMPSLTLWTWVWGNSRSWRWTGRLGMLQSTGLQRVEHYWATELNWTDCKNGDFRKPLSVYAFDHFYFFDLLLEKIGMVGKLGSMKEYFKLYYKIFIRYIKIS